MTLMANAAVAGGATAIRANGPADVAAIRTAVSVPIVGLNKQGERSGVFITPTKLSAAEVVRAGADIVALDGTRRIRTDGSTLEEQIRFIHEELGVPVMADVESFESGIAARLAGADAVATSLAGYTGASVPDGPDIELLAALAAKLDCPVIAEGRYRTAEDIEAAFAAGAHAIVIGTAITNPADITARLVRALPSASLHNK